MSKSLKDMNQTELYDEAKKLNIKGRSKLKSKAKRDELISKIIEARKEAQTEFEDEDEQKYSEKSLRGRKEAMKEREDRILEEALNELDEEKSRERMIEESLDEIEADRAQRRGDFSESANERLERITRENQPPAEFVRQQRGGQRGRFSNVLTAENINKLKSYFDADTVDKIQNLYKETDKLITEHGIRDGVIRAGLKFLAPELNLMQQAADFLGLGYDDEDHKKLMDTILTGKSDRGSAEDMKLGFKLVFNPVEWGRLAYEEAFAIGDNVTTGVKDLIRKARGIKKTVVDEQAEEARGERKVRGGG